MLSYHTIHCLLLAPKKKIKVFADCDSDVVFWHRDSFLYMTHDNENESASFLMKNDETINCRKELV